MIMGRIQRRLVMCACKHEGVHVRCPLCVFGFNKNATCNLNCSEFGDGRTDWAVTISAMQGSERSSKEDRSNDKPVGKVRKKECKKQRRKEGRKEACKNSYHLHYFSQLRVASMAVEF